MVALLKMKEVRDLRTKGFSVHSLIIVILFSFVIFTDISISAEEPYLLSLKDGLKMVTEESRLLRIASLSENMSEMDVKIARSRFLPSINAYARQTFLANQPGARFGYAEVYTSEREFLSYGVTLYQSLYRGGADLSLYSASEKDLEIRRNDIKRLRNLVAVEFISAYLELLEIDRLINVAEREVESLEAHLEEAITMYEEGVITKNEKLEIEVRLSDARQRLLSLKNQRSFYVSRINSMLLMPLNRDFRVEDIRFNETKNAEIISLEEAWQEAINTRPELRTIEREIEKVRLQQRAKMAEYYPEFFVQAGYDYTENRYQLHEENWSLIFGVNINLFKGGATASEIKKLRYRERQLIEERERLMDEIRLEIKKFYIGLKNSMDRLSVTGQAVLQAEENLRINRLRFEEGIGKSSDVLDAIALFTLAETNYQSARYEFLKAKAGLEYAMGKDLVAIYGGEDGRNSE
ncbi:MAG: TolC family protein [Thermodesulfovibrionales bacterium]